MSRFLRFALLGDPVAHSRSPAIHRAALSATELHGEYRAVRADETALSRAVDDLREGAYDGLNITMPLKSAAAALADEMTVLAREAASVNTLRSRDGVIEAHSTDSVAFRGIFEEAARFPPQAPILLLGYGGSARALLAAIQGREIYVSGRSRRKAEKMAERFEVSGALNWGSVLSGAIVVNATPIGMRGEALPDEILEAASGLIDLPYGDRETPAVGTARKAGAPFVDGIEFLARQAAASFEWWTGRTVDSITLARAARNV